MRLLLFVLSWLLIVPLSARAQPGGGEQGSVYVRILSLDPPVEVTLRTRVPGRVLLGSIQETWSAAQTLRVTATARGVSVRTEGGPARVGSVLTVSSPDMRLDHGRYTGAITFRTPDGRTLYAVNRAPLEHYVADVVASEALPGTPSAALRAQAIAARSYAAALARLDRRRDRALGPHASEGYDFCDLTHCQSFRGRGGGDAGEAARATRGQVLFSGSRVVAAWYHSTCGGRTAAPSEVGADVALRGVSDVGPNQRPWCAASPHFRWRVDIPAGRLLQALAADRETAPGSVLQDVRVRAREVDGRVREVEIVGERHVRVSGQTFWQVVGRELGWGQIESAWFTVRRTGAGFRFEGRGLGHGAGLCQYGSIAMARAGWNTKQILAHYYPGTRIGTVSR